MYLTFLLVLVLSVLLIVLNKLIFQLIQNKSNSQLRTYTKGLETYEFGTHSIGLITTLSNNQFIILSIIFLLFDIELIFIIP